MKRSDMRMARRSFFPLIVFALLAALPRGLAQETPVKSAEPVARETRAAPSEKPRLPADSTAEFTLNVAGRSLSFKATAGSLRLADDNGAPNCSQAEPEPGPPLIAKVTGRFAESAPSSW
jgi:hypothetical protein